MFTNETKIFANADIACATFNYRYASILYDIHHPDLPDDIKLAVEFIVSKSYDWDISSDRFGLVGHSAGGHLSLITSYTLNNQKIKACASWAGPVNFTDTDQLSVVLAKETFETYMGFPLNSSSDTLLYQQASPYFTVQSTSIPTLMIHATQDDGVPYSTAQNMEHKLIESGVIFKFVTLQGANHIWTGNNLETARFETLHWFQSKLNE